MAVDKIANGVVATIAYTLTVDGEVIEEASKEDPLEYLHGAENIVPGLEAALLGKTIGDKLSVTLDPEDAYGEYDEDNFEEIEPADLPDDIEEGMEILIEDDDGNMYEAIVSEITDDAVVLDFNPDLAGKTVTFDVEVIALREADDEEMDHGHPHSYHDDDYDDYEDM